MSGTAGKQVRLTEAIEYNISHPMKTCIFFTYLLRWRGVDAVGRAKGVKWALHDKQSAAAVAKDGHL